MNLDLEHHGLTGQVGVIVLGEGDVNVLLIAGLQTHDALFKAGNKGVGAQLQGVVLGLAALEGHAVVKALKVQQNGIAHLGLALHVYQAGRALDIGLELVFDVLVGDGDSFLLRTQALVRTDLGLGSDGDHGLKGKAVLAHLQDFHFGVGHHIQLLLLHGLGVSGGIKLFDGVFIEHAGAVHTLDDLPGGLALPEAGDGDAAPLLLVDLVQRGLKLLSPDLDDQLYGAVLYVLFTLDVHLLTSSCYFVPCAGT